MTLSLGIDLRLNSIKLAYISKGEPVVILDCNGAVEIPAFVGFGREQETPGGKGGFESLAASSETDCMASLLIYPIQDTLWRF